MKKNYLVNTTSEEKTILKNVLHEKILINLRTYDKTSMVLYANDHLNNFIHLYMDNGTKFVYLFNYGNEIKNITIDYPKLNSGKSVQIAILRNESATTLHVNEANKTLIVGIKSLEQYSNKPWINPEIGKISER